MNKQEIENEIIRYDAIKEIAEKRLTELIELKADFTEAEKPKRRHGDFGISESGGARIVLCHECNLITAGNGSTYPHEYEGYNPNPVFGNIFDLMKDWGEDLEEFKIKISCDMRTFIIEKSGWNLKDLYIGIKDDNAPESRKGVQLTLEEAEEIWRKLGQMIMTLKRKQSKT